VALKQFAGEVLEISCGNGRGVLGVKILTTAVEGHGDGIMLLLMHVNNEPPDRTIEILHF
jgi:hypothetical protein